MDFGLKVEAIYIDFVAKFRCSPIRQSWPIAISHIYCSVVKYNSNLVLPICDQWLLRKLSLPPREKNP
jgi:hypothetical protein